MRLTVGIYMVPMIKHKPKRVRIMYTEILEALFIVIPFVSVPFLMFGR